MYKLKERLEKYDGVQQVVVIPHSTLDKDPVGECILVVDTDDEKDIVVKKHIDGGYTCEVGGAYLEGEDLETTVSYIAC